MSRTSTNVAPSLQAYFLETSAEAAELARGGTEAAVVAPWTGRKLRQALAEIGPVQPILQPDAIPGAVYAAPEPSAPSRPLPPPPRPMFQATGIDRLADGSGAGMAPSELVRALADAVPQPLTFAPRPADPAPLMADAFERPPMIIERAHAERELRAGSPLMAPARPNPLPALAIGFALALACGAALYFALAGA